MVHFPSVSDFDACRGLSCLHPRFQVLTRWREWLYHNTLPDEARAAAVLEVSTGVALFYISHSDELVPSDQQNPRPSLEGSHEDSRLIEKVLDESAGKFMSLDMHPGAVLRAGEWSGPVRAN